MLVTRVTESGLTSYVTGQEIAALDKDPLKGRVHTSRRSVADRFFFLEGTDWEWIPKNEKGKLERVNS